MSDKTLVPRKASALVRDLGLGTAVILAIFNVVGLGWQKRVFQAAGVAPVPKAEWFLGVHPMVMAFLLVGILVLLSLYTFTVLSAAIPRSGGGYVFMTRILGSRFGFIASWMEFFSIAVSYGLMVVATFEAILIFGGLAGVDISVANRPLILTLIGVVVIVIFSGLASLGARMTGRILQVMFWVPAAIMVLGFILFLTANPTTMEAGVLAITGGHHSVEYAQAAVLQGMKSAGYWNGVFTAMFFAYWAYIGYAAVSFVAGEVRETSRSMPRVVFISGILVMITYMVISILLTRAGGMIGQYKGWSFIDAVAFMDRGGGSFAAAGLKPIGSWMSVFAGIQAFGLSLVAGRIMGWLLVIFGLFWVVNDIPPFILTCSRMIFAMGIDRVLPEKLAEVNEKWHSPINAIIATSIAALVGVVSEAGLFAKASSVGKILNSAGAVTATDFWDVIFFAGVAVACAIFPTKLPEVFNQSPFKQRKIEIQVIGWLAAIGNILMGVLLIFHKNGFGFGPGNWDSPNFWITVFLILVGLGFYALGRRRAKRAKADLSTPSTEIAPE